MKIILFIVLLVLSLKGELLRVNGDYNNMSFSLKKDIYVQDNHKIYIIYWKEYSIYDIKTVNDKYTIYYQFKF